MVSANHASSNDCYRTCVNYVSLAVLVFGNKKIGVEWFMVPQVICTFVFQMFCTKMAHDHESD